MRKPGWENLTLTGHSESKTGRRETISNLLNEAEQGTGRNSKATNEGQIIVKNYELTKKYVLQNWRDIESGTGVPSSNSS